MSKLRHYFVSGSLDDLEQVEEELEAQGVATAQIHVLSLDESGVDSHSNLNGVPSLLKRDVIHSGLKGAAIGVIGAGSVLGVVALAGWASAMVGWVPFIFLAIVVFGFATWEGGLLGIQSPNRHFVQFEQVLAEGKHIFFVDVLDSEKGVLDSVVANHPRLVPAL